MNNSFNERKLDLIEMNELNESFIKTHFPKIALEAHRRTIWAYFSTLNQVILSEDKNVVEKFAPSLVDYLLSQGNFILKNPFNPTRDKIAYVLLKFFGLEGYKRAWKTYLKLTK